MQGDETLAERWIPLWQQQTGGSWSDATSETADELERQLRFAARARAEGNELDTVYGDLAETLGGLAPRTRGSGALAAVLSLWLAWQTQDRPSDGLLASANLIGSDTDTIATMAGALLGCVAATDPPGPILDEELLRRDAQRLEGLAAREVVEDFPHPDPMLWQPPSTLVDVVGLVDGTMALAGLGQAQPLAGLIEAPGKDGSGWQWLGADFGQQLLIKRRASLEPLGEWALPRRRETAPTLLQAADLPQVAPRTDATPPPALPDAARSTTPTPRSRDRDALPTEVEDAVANIVARKFDQIQVARLLFHLARQPYGQSKAAAFAGEVARLLREREGLDDQPK